jgi:hypothetical protein
VSAAVPEPGAYALLLGGLLTMRLLFRRRLGGADSAGRG